MFDIGLRRMKRLEKEKGVRAGREEKCRRRPRMWGWGVGFKCSCGSIGRRPHCSDPSEVPSDCELYCPTWSG